jgi:phenylalanyl-tRNA synthetase beta chain
MKFTMTWLREHLETEASVDYICDALTDLGLEVEAVENPAAALREFTIGQVKSCAKHPDADRLTVCQVETEKGIKQIICGAPNARAGITVVIAHAGMYIPGIKTTIKIGKIRGVESHGMMCSEREMQLSDEHEGIIELGSGAVGDRFVDWLAAHDPAKVDTVIDIAITPNRPDALGVRGIARDLAARGLGVLKAAKLADVPGSFASPINVTIDADTRVEGCEVFMGRLVRGVTNGPSPQWLQDRLRAIGLRPISALVDITNFFTYDRNRPLHVFDADKVVGDLRVHRALGGEVMVGLDEKEHTLSTGMVVISDDAGIASIGGIMGGLRTGCTGETVNVFVEAAVWETIQVARTGRALKINSDARYRNERGIDPVFNRPALGLAAEMIVEICGGEASEIVSAGAVPDVARAYRLDTDRVQSLVGMEIAPDVQRATLAALGFVLDGDMAAVPSWRPDVQGEADLVEEIARIASLGKLVSQPMARLHVGVPKPILSRAQRRESTARRTVAALGYNECVTYSFIDKAGAELFGGGADATMLANPISSEMSHMRPDLLCGLLQAAARNQARGIGDLALFEVGPVFHGGEPEEHQVQVAGLLVGHSAGRDPHGSRRSVDVYDAKADAEAVLSAIGAPARPMINRNAPDWWHPGRSGQIMLGPKNVLAAFGEVHPRVLSALGVKGPAVAFTVWPERVPYGRAQTATRAALVSTDLQAVERDFAFVVDAGVEAIMVVNAAAGADKALIARVAVFDEFAGARAEAQMGVGKKSLAISVRMQPVEKTLTDAEIEAVSAKIIASVGKATGGVLRG